MKNKNYFIIVVVAILIKILLFSFICIPNPQSKFRFDSDQYIKTAQVLVTQGVFGSCNDQGQWSYESRRTPGYPVFLGMLHGFMKIPLTGVVLIQILMTMAVAYLTYKAGVVIDPAIGFLSAVIVLYSPIVTIFSMMILTETLFLFLMAFFMLFFLQYLKHPSLKWLVAFSLCLALASYVRPGAYFLGMVVALFLVYAHRCKDLLVTIRDILIFLFIVYGLLGIWQLRNQMHFGSASFSSILQGDPSALGLYKSYARNSDPSTRGISPVLYYINVSSRCFLSVLTSPGSFKYFQCHLLTVVGRFFGYFWVAFWMSGFVYGTARIKGNIYYQFLLLVILYFIGGSVFAELWNVSARFRVPIVPYIAIISAYGWMGIKSRFNGTFGSAFLSNSMKAGNASS